MNVLFFPFVGALYAFSLLPFWTLHRVSDVMFVLVYHVIGYRRGVVGQNLKLAFPEKNMSELSKIERAFYRNFCDLLVETLKTFSMPRSQLEARMRFVTPETSTRLSQAGVPLTGFSSHLGNWEWQALSLPLQFRQTCYGVYKPLSQKFFDRIVKRNRGRFGMVLVSFREMKKIVRALADAKPALVGLLSDQRPHQRDKAICVEFLGQMTPFFNGGPVLTVTHGLTPIWGWVRRTGRSRYEWGTDDLSDALVDVTPLSPVEVEEVLRVQTVHGLSAADAGRVFRVTRAYVRGLEARIRAQPEDWLWSHRRWK